MLSSLRAVVRGSGPGRHRRQCRSGLDLARRGRNVPCVSAPGAGDRSHGPSHRRTRGRLTHRRTRGRPTGSRSRERSRHGYGHGVRHGRIPALRPRALGGLPMRRHHETDTGPSLGHGHRTTNGRGLLPGSRRRHHGPRRCGHARHHGWTWPRVPRLQALEQVWSPATDELQPVLGRSWPGRFHEPQPVLRGASRVHASRVRAHRVRVLRWGRRRDGDRLPQDGLRPVLHPPGHRSHEAPRTALVGNLIRHG